MTKSNAPESLPMSIADEIFLDKWNSLSIEGIDTAVRPVTTIPENQVSALIFF